MARTTIRRGKTRASTHAWRSGLIAALCLLGVSAIVPLRDAPGVAARSSGAVTIALDPPAPFNPALDPVALVQASATTMPEIPIGANADEIGALVQASLSGNATPDQPLALPTLFSPGLAAPAVLFRSRSPADNARAALCLTTAIYYEAANEPDAGQAAVAQVILNRVRHPAFPKTVCDVVYQGTERPGVLCQFTFACDGAMARIPALGPWMRARRAAVTALAGSVYAPVGLSTNYHTLAVSPSWGKTLTPTAIVGAHIFYRLPGGAGEPRSFAQRYVGREPVPGPRPKLFSPADPLIFASAATGSVAAATPAVPPVVTAAVVPTPVIPATTQVWTAAPVKRVAEDKRYVQGTLPESDIRPEYRESGAWIAR